MRRSRTAAVAQELSEHVNCGIDAARIVSWATVQQYVAITGLPSNPDHLGLCDECL